MAKFNPANTVSVSQSVASLMSDVSASSSQPVSSDTGASSTVGSQPEKREQIFSPGYQQSFLGAFRCTAPMISAVISNPGIASSETARIDALSSLIAHSLVVSDSIARECCPDISNYGWVRQQLLSLTSKMIGDEWKTTGGNVNFALSMAGIGLAVKDSGAYALNWLDKSGNIPPVRNETDAASYIRLSVAKGYAPLFREIQEFSFWKNRIDKNAPLAIGKRLCAFVMEKSAHHANTLADANGINPEVRVMYWQSVIGRMFEMTLDVYKKAAHDAKNAVEKTDDLADRSAIRKKFATSDHVLDDIEKDTERAFRDFSIVVEQFVNNAHSFDIGDSSKDGDQAEKTRQRVAN